MKFIDGNPKEKNGMYGGTRSVVFGKYNISKMVEGLEADSVWIENEDEGGEFSESEFESYIENCINTFFNERF